VWESNQLLVVFSESYKKYDAPKRSAKEHLVTAIAPLLPTCFHAVFLCGSTI
jgi:hypothetical protein